jgi:hypothetical protein
VKTLFEDVTDEAEETAFFETSADVTTTSPLVSDYRLLPLTVNQGERRVLVGTIAVRMNGIARPVSHEFLQDVAAQLFQAGDVTTVRVEY